MARCLVMSARAPLAGHVIDGLEAAGHTYGILTTPQAATGLGRRNAFAAEATPLMRAEPFDPRFLADVAAWCVETRMDVVIGADLVGTKLAAALQDHGIAAAVFPTAEADVLDTVNDKWDFYNLLGTAGLASPETWLLRAPEEIPNAPWHYPVVVKPRALGGGLLIERVADADALTKLAQSWPRRHWPMLVQTFLPGTDFDVSILAQDGQLVAWTLQRWSSETTLEMIADHAPARTLVAGAVAAAGYSGVAHFDLRLSDATGTPFLIECNPRFWATLDASLKSGVNFVDLGVQLALGHDPGQIPRAREGRITYPGAPGHTSGQLDVLV